jgi:hypothetical protein
MLRELRCGARRYAGAVLLVASIIGGPGTLAVCDRHECSNDVRGTYGDEVLAWSPLSPWSWGPRPGKRCYEVGERGSGNICALRCEYFDGVSVHEPASWLGPYTLPRPCAPEPGQSIRYDVRACTGGVCGPWSEDYVEFVGVATACFDNAPVRGRCEKPCYPGAPRRFPEILACPPPEVQKLRVEKDRLTWASMDDAISYEMARGDIGRLQKSLGDVGWSVQDCVVGIGKAGLLTPDSPFPGEAHWYLVKPVGPYGSGSWYSDGSPDSEKRVEDSMRGCVDMKEADSAPDQP